MRKIIPVILSAILLLPHSVVAQTTIGYNNYSKNVANTIITLIPATAKGVRRTRVKAINYHVTVNVWCTWGGTPAVATVGSFRLAAGGGGFDDFGGAINQLALNCIADAAGPANVFAETYNN